MSNPSHRQDKHIEAGVVHKLPENIKKAILENEDLLTTWNALTPLARNEWICRVTMAKKQATRDKRLARLCEDLGDGKKRPCCRPGCPHRRESAKKRFR